MSVMRFLASLQRFRFCKYFMKNNGLFFAIRQKKKVFVVASFLVPTSVSLFSWKNARYRFLFLGFISFLLNLSPIIVLHADAYGPLSKDKDLEVIKEKKWSVETGGMVGSLNGSATYKPPLPFLLYQHQPTTLYLVEEFSPKNNFQGSTYLSYFNFSYYYSKRFTLDFGLTGFGEIPSSAEKSRTYYYSFLGPFSISEFSTGSKTKTDRGSTLGFKYFFLDEKLKPFVSVQTGSTLTSDKIIPFVIHTTLSLGGRYELSDDLYLDTSIYLLRMKTSFRGSTNEGTGYGLDFRAGYLF